MNTTDQQLKMDRIRDSVHNIHFQHAILKEARMCFRREAISLTDSLLELSSRDDWNNDIEEHANFRSPEDCLAYIVEILGQLLDEEIAREDGLKIEFFNSTKNLLVFPSRQGALGTTVPNERDESV